MKHPLIPFLPFFYLPVGRVLFVITLVAVTQQMFATITSPVLVSIWDKWLHMGAWGLMTGLGFLASRSLKAFWSLAFVLALYSTLVEYLQPIVAERFFSYGDIVANLLGILIATGLITWFNQHSTQN